MVLAQLFGASAAMAAYNVAFRLPNLLRDLFAEGAMSAAFVPTFTKYVHGTGKESAWRLGNLVITALAVITGLCVLLGIIFAEPLVRLITDDKYTADAAQLALTVQLARLMMPVLTFIALAAALMGMLNSLHRFFIPALSPAMEEAMVLANQLMTPPPPPSLGASPAARSLEAVILKCLRKRPENRYASMEALVEDLGRLGRPGALAADAPIAAPDVYAAQTPYGEHAARFLYKQLGGVYGAAP